MKKTLVILSGELMERSDLGYFQIDTASIVTHKPRLVVDYNHDEEMILGYVENIRCEDGKLVGDATLESVVEGDKAAEVIARVEAGTPFEISPTVMLNDLDVEIETASKGDIEYKVYRQVPLRGVSICPYGTDKLTSLLSLNGGKIMKKRSKRLTRMAADEQVVADAVETAVVDEAGGEGEGGVDAVVYDAYPLLEQFISEFGFDLGVEFFRRGYTLEEAQAADYEQLKAKRLAAEEEAGAMESVEQIDDAVPEAEAEAALVEAAQEAVEEAGEEEKTTLKANIQLARAVRSLTAEVAKLKAISTRGGEAIKSSQRKGPPLNAVQKMARKIHNR